MVFLRALSVGRPGLSPVEQKRGTYSWNAAADRGVWSHPSNWGSSAVAGGSPATNGLASVDVAFGPGGAAFTSVLDGAYAVRGVQFTTESTDVSLKPSTGAARLILGAAGLVQSGGGHHSIEAPVKLASDQVWRLDKGTLTVASLDLQHHRLTVTGAGQLTVERLIGGSASQLVAGGPGPLMAGGMDPAASFTGALRVADGILAPGPVVLNSVRLVEVGGGALTLPPNATLDSPASLRLSGGVVAVNGASGHLGPLQLAGIGTLRLGSGAGSLGWSSATLENPAGRLVVEEWQGTGGQSGTGRKLFIQSPPPAPVLAAIQFAGAGFDSGALRLASGEIVPPLRPLAMLPANAAAALQSYGPGLIKTVVPVTGQTFTEAARVNTTQRPAQVYSSGVVLRTTAAVEANHHLVARFWIRRIAPESGPARVQFNFEKASGNFDKSVEFPVTLTDSEWHLQEVKFRSRGTYAAGEAEVSIWAGYGVQIVEVGAIELLNYQRVTPP